MINLELTSDDILKFVGELYLDNRIKEDKIFTLSQKVEELVKEVSILKSGEAGSIRELKNQIESLNNEIIRLNQTNTNLKNYADNIEQTAYRTAEERDRLRYENANLIDRAKKLEEDYNSLKLELNSGKYTKNKKRNEVGTANT